MPKTELSDLVHFIGLQGMNNAIKQKAREKA